MGANMTYFNEIIVTLKCLIGIVDILYMIMVRGIFLQPLLIPIIKGVKPFPRGQFEFKVTYSKMSMNSFLLASPL